MAAPPPPPVAHLRLERRKANMAFSSWRLSSSIAQSQGSLSLPAPAAPAQASDTDYVTARHAALLNALVQQPQGCYTFLEEGPGSPNDGGRLGLYQMDLGEPHRLPTLSRVCGIPPHQQEAVPGGLTAGRLPPSAVEVQAAGAAAGSRVMLVSAGCGDVSLVVRPSTHEGQPIMEEGAGAALSPAVCPLRPAPPLQGVRPLHLAAAFLLPPLRLHAAAADGPPPGGGSSGVQAGSLAAAGGPDPPSPASAEICCILWAAQPRGGRKPSCCEVYAVHFLAELAAPEPTLQVLGMQLLKVSDLPPHGVLVNPAAGSVLLALQPSSASVEEEAAAQRAAAAATAAAAGAGAGTSSGAGPSAMQEDEDEDDVSPRTLAAAVARLAAYTSEEPVGPLPHQQYADLYRETGSDGIGAMGSEPTCTLFTFALPAEAAPTITSAAAGAGAGAGTADGAASSTQGEQPGQLLQLVHTLSCQPHKLLTCHLQPPSFGAAEPPTPDTHVADGGGSGGTMQPAGRSSDGHRLLLGLTDDVDCAVVAISCSDGAPGSGGSSSGPSGSSGSSGGGGGEGGAAGFIIEHVTSIPAMAYVAAGKVQRKFLLLASPGGDISAALAEAGKYCYLYRSTAPRQEYGEHQVVDMELPDSSGRGLLGAVLAGCRAGACRLVLLAREGLRVVDM